MNRRTAMMRATATLVAGLVPVGGLQAQSVIGQPVLTIIVGGPPGGLFDIALRIVGERLGAELGMTMVIENKPGAGTAVALAYARTAPTDGSAAILINLSATANESIIRDRGYSLLDDFDPVGLYFHPANILIVNPALPATDLAGFAEWLKGRGDAANYSSGGVGSPGHLAGALFNARIGGQALHVPYKGAPPAVLAVATGEVDYMFATASSAAGQIAAGAVRALAVTTSQRLAQFSDVPTAAEAGLADFDVSDWVGCLLPKGTSAEVRDRLHAAMLAAFTDPANLDRLREATFVPASPPLGPDEFAAHLRAEVAKWAEVVAAAGIAAQ